jgi:GAF domain-containing protein
MSHFGQDLQPAFLEAAGGIAYQQTFQVPGETTSQCGLVEAISIASLDPETLMEQVLHYLARVTRCSASGLLLIDGLRGHVMLYRSRPVDDLFMRAVQRRILSIYRVCVGPAAGEPDIEVTVLGEAIPGPYEPPRSLLATPVLCEGRVSGVIAVASVFPEAFGSRDLCMLSAVAAQASAALIRARPEERSLGSGEPPVPEGRLWSQVNDYLASIRDLAMQWQIQGDGNVPEALVQDLGSIAENARQIRELLTC